MTEFSHIPVLLEPTIEHLNVKENGIYVDGTLGGAGHSKEILKKAKIKRLIGIDQDEEALAAAKANLKDFDNVTYVHGNFKNIDDILDELELQEPEIITKNGNSSLKLKAKASSLHIMKVDVEAEVCDLFSKIYVCKMIENGKYKLEKAKS